MEPRDHAFMADKLVALEREKAEFCYTGGFQLTVKTG